jgi:hypothetical protein
MVHAYLTGEEQPKTGILMPKGQAVAGYAIGIIVIDIWYPLLPGNVANASTFPFPVLYSVLHGASIEQIMTGDPELWDLIQKAGNELLSKGVRCVAGACGSFAYFQKKAAAAFRVPTFMSTMLQVPLILQSLQPEQKLGIVAASAGALTPRVYEQCDIRDTTRLIVTEAKNLPEFQGVMNCTGRFNSSKLESELVELVSEFVSHHPEIGALLFQCSDLPPYAWAIQQAVNLPVFDMTSLIGWAYQAVVRRPFAGFI